MAKQYIWRVQNEFGNGPYRGLGNLSETFNMIAKAGRMPHRDRRPPPSQDKGLKDQFPEGATLNPRSLCGFKDIQQYHKWFSTQEQRDVLHHAGYFLAKYAVEGLVAHGETQSLFFAKNAKLVAVRPCNGAGVLRPRNPDDLTLKAAARFLKKKRSIAPQ